MIEESRQEPVIVIRRSRRSHAGHHGGAWKVAYADFVTAMMSLFIVLWLTSTNDMVRKSVARYFNDPMGTSDQNAGRPNAIQPKTLDIDAVHRLKAELIAAERRMPNFDRLKSQVEITAHQDGVRIELLEQPGGTFFESGSAEPTEALRQFLTAISPELGRMQNRISIEGHTDSVPYSGSGAYTNWELSADRANAARRLMQASGVAAGQIAEVRGFADQSLRRPEAPDDASNRRITLIVAPRVLSQPVAVGHGVSAADFASTASSGELKTAEGRLPGRSGHPSAR